MLFVVVLIPLSIILNETDLGYITSGNQELSYLLFMDYLKLYAKSKRKLDLFIQTMGIFSDDVSMVFGLDKCAVLVVKRGKIVRTEAIQLLDRISMGEVNLNKYKYLGVLQLEPIMNREQVKSEYT